MTREKNVGLYHPRKRRIIISFILLWNLMADVTTVSSFTPLVVVADPMIRTTNSLLLFAKKPQSKNKNPKPAASASGFGSATQNNNSLEGKVRSVSGHAGSGSKPLRIAANTFDAIRKEFGKDCSKDVYCRSPLDDPQRFWFVGKVAWRPNTAATPQQAILSQKRIILEYAKSELRPQNFGGKFSANLELWLAPADSEMDAVQNKVELEPVLGSAISDLDDDFSVADVGYNPEIYIGDERKIGGLRILRDDQGKPVKAVFEVNESA
jgi:hypothetical protein